MNKFLETVLAAKNRKGSSGVAERKRDDALRGALVANKIVDLVAKRWEAVDALISPDDLLELCESIIPADFFRGAGWLFEFYFVLDGPKGYRRMLKAHATRGVRDAIYQMIVQRLKRRFYWWTLSSIRRHSQRSLTKPLFFISLLHDLKGLSG